MQITNTTIVKYISLLAMISFSLLEIIYKQTTVFYILYLFWFDELIRTIFEKITYYFKKNEIENPVQYLKSVNGKFYFLFLYLIFIFVFFGLIIDRNDFDLIAVNFTVLFFKNSFFNYSLLVFVLREVYLYRENSAHKEPNSLLSIRIFILHISIVLGVLFWALSTQKFHFMEAYANSIAIVPFLLLKVIIEINSNE